MTEAARTHVFPLRVYWEDTDAAGIVYYANYLKFMERARSDLVRRAGVDQAELLREDGIMFPVRRCEVDYLSPARLEDELEVVTTVRKLGGASIDLDQDIRAGGRLLVKGRVRLGCVHVSGRPSRMPGPVREALSGAAPPIEGEG
jgi:acyl-CoA thioester hydrolase